MEFIIQVGSNEEANQALLSRPQKEESEEFFGSLTADKVANIACQGKHKQREF